MIIIIPVKFARCNGFTNCMLFSINKNPFKELFVFIVIHAKIGSKTKVNFNEIQGGAQLPYEI